MRIVHIVPEVRIGGVLQHLRVAKFQLPEVESVIVSIFDMNHTEALIELGSDVISLRLPMDEYGNVSFVRRELHAALSKIAPSVVHSHHNFSDWYAVPVAHEMGIGMIRTVHGITQRDIVNPSIVADKKLDWSHDEIARQVRLDPLVAHTFAVSWHLRAKLLGYGLAPEKVSVLYPGIRPAEEWSLRLIQLSVSKDETFHVAFPHRLDPIKNPSLMVDILKRLVDEGLRVRFYVPQLGSNHGEIESKILRCGLTTSVTWLPRGIDVWKHIPRADVVLLTSISEGLPLTILEAMVRSIPVVAPKVGGIPEAISDCESGLLIESDCVDAYVTALRRLANDREFGERLGTAGQRRALSTFTAEQHLKILLDAYRAIGGAGNG